MTELETKGSRSPRKGGSLFRLSQKELRETLRDRRTIVTLIAMPLIVYPILSLIFKTFLLSNLGLGAGENLIKYRYLLLSEEQPTTINEEDFLVRLIQSIDRDWQELNPAETLGKTEESSGANGAGESTIAGENNLPDLPKENTVTPSSGPKLARFAEHLWSFGTVGRVDPAAMLKDRQQDAVIVLNDRAGRFDADVFYSDQDSVSRNAARFFKERLANYNLRVLQRKLKMQNLDSRLFIKAADQKVLLPEPKNQFTTLIPLVLVLMTITGAVYPAIDLTAGERERGTLETLIAAPLPRIRVLIAKMIAVITVSVLTASLNVVGMLTTIWAFQLEDVLLGEAGLTLAMCVKIFLLLALFATFFAALLLVVTSFARSFKEAQAYLIPIILMSMAPGLMALTPGLKLDGPLAVCPMVNLLLLSRDVLENQVLIIPAAVAIFSTCVYAVLGIAAAASIFGADSILYGGQSGWKELFSRPVAPSPVAPLNVAMLCLFVLLPINFVAIAFLGRLAKPGGVEVSVAFQLLAMSFFTFLAFWVFPTLVSLQQKIRTGSGFGIVAPRPHMFLVAFILGLSLWPLVMALISGWYELLGLFYGAQASSDWHERLSKFSADQAEKFREASPFVIAFSMSLVPSICEEWFFRGMLLRSFLSAWRPWLAILASAAIFGVFHTLSGSVVSFDRLLPTTIMGLILGYLAYKSNSLLPGILMHATHNATIAFIAYYLPQLNSFSWFPKDAETIPVFWTIASAVIGSGCMFILWRSHPPITLESKTEFGLATNRLP